MDKFKTAIVGNKDTILGFKALGLETHDSNTGEEATAKLFELKKKEIVIDSKTGETRPAYAVIFITEDLAMKISDEDYKKLSENALPAIVPVPGSKGTSGYGLKRIGKMVERAVGSDIFGDQ
ncbi:V-type ATP synthase subunit F [Candidatus Peregrinibacteria bacterium]|jgi:V/A-type H+/Na+-transporting ATPase subunit F|nr:V-type ATP synthase subunit F [Candidatus Peregrinibacteria bacterium]MBT7736711.1 V-type ATP synthase subunit F [Candidatus Peregrinibacteria bacterium]